MLKGCGHGNCLSTGRRTSQPTNTSFEPWLRVPFLIKLYPDLSVRACRTPAHEFRTNLDGKTAQVFERNFFWAGLSSCKVICNSHSWHLYGIADLVPINTTVHGAQSPNIEPCFSWFHWLNQRINSCEIQHRKLSFKGDSLIVPMRLCGMGSGVLREMKSLVAANFNSSFYAAQW